ncbi:MAG: YaiO family outer membrane beta-barrel protein [Verrucomicrobia bacterium]|nr:YaiO family outer membrane beta-barrel protein [Verrucomicrobiota bacterium]
MAQTVFNTHPPAAGSAIPSGQRASEDPETLRLHAHALAKRGQIGEALAVVRRLLRTSPASAQYRLMEAQYLGWLGRTASAGERYRRLMQENPSDAPAQEGFGNTQLWRGNWRDAQSAYASAISISGADSVPAHVGHFRALLGAGRATPAYRQALDLDRRTGRQDAEVGLLLAGIHAAVDNDDAAFALSNRRTGDPDVRLRQAAFQTQRLIVRGQKDAGLNLIASYAEAHARDYNALVAAGEAFTTAGKPRDARHYFDRAAQLAPDRDEARLGLARMSRQQGNHRDSLAQYEDVVARNPESLPGWLGIADVAQLRGDLARAWQALDSAQRVAPGSALVYRERLKIAFREGDADTFRGVLRDYQRAQPLDAWPALWAQKWADAHGGEVSAAALQALLDPLAPEVSGEALRLLRRQTGEPLQRVVQRVPAAPGADLQEAAQEKLGKQVRIADSSVIGVSTGYEFASLQDTTGAGARLQEWHEGYLAAYWRRQLGMTISGEYRTYSRFGASANQLLLGWGTHLTPSWLVGLEAGGALNGGFIPRWRIGARGEYLFTDTFSASLSVSHLRFADEPVLQFVPGLSWQWHPQWTTHARMYVTHDQPKGAPASTGLAGMVGTTWQFAPLSSVGVSYALGEENASQLIKGLIGEKNFQSVAVDLKWGINEHFTLQPSYRYEAHNLFDLHAIGLGLHLRY